LRGGEYIYHWSVWMLKRWRVWGRDEERKKQIFLLANDQKKKLSLANESKKRKNIVISKNKPMHT